MQRGLKGYWKLILLMLAAGLIFTACGSNDDNDDNDTDPVLPPVAQTEDIRPVVFVHGGAGSASQFESQAQRFLANGYPLNYLAVYEYNTRLNVNEEAETNNAGINAIIDRLLQETGADKVDLIGHSMGTWVDQLFLSTPENAARVAHYVNVDGATADALPGGVPTLALWGMGDHARTIVGAENDYNDAQSHIQTCTSAESFTKMYTFFNGEAPATSQIPESGEENVNIAGRANIFPENIGAAGRTLSLYEVDPATGFRVDPEAPVYVQAIGADGDWGPVSVKKGVTYEFYLAHDTDPTANQAYYREPFLADDYFIRLNTSEPDAGIGVHIVKSPNHVSFNIGRDKEMWGDQGAGNDILELIYEEDGEEKVASVLTPEAADQAHRLSSIFLFDMGPNELENGDPDPNYDGVSDLSVPNTYFDSLPFISGLDLYVPAASPADRTVTIELTPRGGNGAVQTINVPNWPSDTTRVQVQFRDFVQ